jgi:DNA-directed RNA polymerase
VQDTPWRVNRQILDVARELRETDGAVAGLPSFEPPAFPPKPPSDDPDVVAQWKREKTETLDAEMKRVSKIREVDTALRVAERFVDFERVWFPHNLDWRGRMYTIPTGLQPQGSDLQRGLLTFAEGKPLGDDGVRWLAIHGANCAEVSPWGEYPALDKAPLQERVDWVYDHSDQIVAIAQDPLGNREWMDTENPWQFLAFCFEWAAADDADYVCALPVQMDGSCNGVQHFSAMFRDEVGGASVNLTPSDRPADLYQRVTDEAFQVTFDDAHQEVDADKSQLATLWLQSGLIKRKLAKRPTMTFGYGAKKYGVVEQIMADTLERERVHPAFALEGDEKWDTKYRTFSACRYMTQVLWSALERAVVKAYEAREWMQALCSMVVKSSGEVMTWLAPTGFPVVQRYYRVDANARIKTMLAGVTFMPRKYDVTDAIHKVKQANSIAPNFVHSLDATALVRTVNAAAGLGLTTFSMVHDSFGTTPGDAAVLANVTRQQFVKLYTDHDPVEMFMGACMEQYRGDDELPPEKGSLDIQQVLHSSYFFA